jgi:hypothetical protein
VTRHNGVEFAELGTGGGHGDLGQQHELEVWDPAIVAQLIGLCATKLHDQKQLLTKVIEMLTSGMQGGISYIGLDNFKLLLEADESRLDGDVDDVPDEVALEKLVMALARMVTKSSISGGKDTRRTSASSKTARVRADGLPSQIVRSHVSRFDHSADRWCADVPILQTLIARRAPHAH